MSAPIETKSSEVTSSTTPPSPSVKTGDQVERNRRQRPSDRQPGRQGKQDDDAA